MLCQYIAVTNIFMVHSVFRGLWNNCLNAFCAINQVAIYHRSASNVGNQYQMRQHNDRLVTLFP